MRFQIREISKKKNKQMWTSMIKIILWELFKFEQESKYNNNEKKNRTTLYLWIILLFVWLQLFIPKRI